MTIRLKYDGNFGGKKWYTIEKTGWEILPIDEYDADYLMHLLKHREPSLEGYNTSYGDDDA